MTLIGFVGRINSGKTTCAKYLEQNYGFYRLSFAGPLRDMLVKANIVTRQDIENKTDFAREMMQKIGTDLIRNQIDPDFWVKKFMVKLTMLRKSGYSHFVVDDVRFPNEAEAIKNLNGILIKINRLDTVADKHESESYVDKLDYDFIIYNDSNIGDLYKALDLIIKTFLK